MQYQIIPKIFKYKDYECEVKESPVGLFGLGYVKLPEGHKYYGVDEIPVECHGELTFGEKIDNKWVIGFDCGHGGDLIPLWKLTIDDTYIKNLLISPNDTFKDNEFIENEIKRIVDQF